MNRRDARLQKNLNIVAMRNRMKAIDKASRKDTSQIYSVFTIALWELLDSTDDDEKMAMINTLFSRTQEIWESAIEHHLDVCMMCSEITGVEIRNLQDIEEGKYDES